MKKYYKYGTLIDTRLNDMNREINTLIFFKDLYIDNERVDNEDGRVILYMERIPPSAVAEISAYCTTTWEDSCPKDLKKKCQDGHIEEMETHA